MSVHQVAYNEILDSLHKAPKNPKLAFTFPGQGAQRVAMGLDAFSSSDASRQVFSVADETVGERLTALCFEGPQEKLTETANAQPAILAASVAYLVAAIESGALRERPAFVAGHSLGEFTALVAAGSLSLPDAITLVRKRGQLMAEAGETNPGTIAAVLGLDKETVEDICRRSGAEPANYNGATQVVVGGTADAVEAASSMAREAGGKILPVSVSGAFHTSLMAPAAVAFGAFVRDARISDPVIPVVGNVEASPLLSEAEVRKDITEQIARPVRWLDSIALMRNHGVTTFVEVGPGRTLTRMLKRIAPEATAANIDSVEALTATI
jgi:[acyl-carrier-protein] S-malonyltransferase